MANVAIKSRADCTELQQKFLMALESPDAQEIPRKERWRWCADQAGYPPNTPIANIVQPIQGLIKEVVDTILMRSSVEAAWTLSAAAGDGLIDPQTKDRLAAARDILDRTVPKKEAERDRTPPMAVVLTLPAKQALRLVEDTTEVDETDIPATQEG